LYCGRELRDVIFITSIAAIQFTLHENRNEIEPRVN